MKRNKLLHLFWLLRSYKRPGYFVGALFSPPAALSIFIGIQPALKSKAEAFPPLSILLSTALHFLTQRRSLAVGPDWPLPAG